MTKTQPKQGKTYPVLQYISNLQVRKNETYTLVEVGRTILPWSIPSFQNTGSEWVSSSWCCQDKEHLGSEP